MCMARRFTSFGFWPFFGRGMLKTWYTVRAVLRHLRQRDGHRMRVCMLHEEHLDAGSCVDVDLDAETRGINALIHAVRGRDHKGQHQMNPCNL